MSGCGRIACCGKQVRAFIILSAGFGEETHEGALLEDRILETVNKYGASLIGPNCIGLMNTWHHSVFSQPIPNLNPQGVDLISSSGATAVFILESAVTKGLQFNSVWSVGNAKQIGVEDVLQYMDEHFDAENDSRIKLLYIESIGDPDRLLFHASSLIRKDVRLRLLSREAVRVAAVRHPRIRELSPVPIRRWRLCSVKQVSCVATPVRS